MSADIGLVDESLYQPVLKRPTVNILNTPHEEGSTNYMGIIKHFELPASMGSLTRTEAEVFNERSIRAHYGQRVPGRSAVIATL